MFDNFNSFLSKSYSFWDDYHEKDMGVLISERETQNLLSLSNKKIGSRGSSILEIGCGSGKNLLPYVGLFDKVSGCDISAVAVEKARSFLGSSCDIRECTFDSLPFMPNSFDVVLLCKTLGVVSHRVHLESLTKNASKMVKPGGVLIVVDFAARDEMSCGFLKRDVPVEVRTEWSELPFLHFSHKSLSSLFPYLSLKSYRYTNLMSCNWNLHRGVTVCFQKQGGCL